MSIAYQKVRKVLNSISRIIQWKLVLLMLRWLHRGTCFGGISYILPAGDKIKFKGLEDGPEAVVNLNSPNALKRALMSGYIGLAEGYIEGEWFTPSLSDLFDFGNANQRVLDRKLSGSYLGRITHKLSHFLRRNSRKGSQKNISAHYDLGNSFFSKWLDASMTYSSALFTERSQETIEDAQLNKYRRIVEELNIKPGHRVLEIGCGWGGFAEFLAKETKSEVTAITISREQYEFSLKRIHNAGLDHLVNIEYCDYRDISGEYDRIVSIEMLEAVGEAYWPSFFKILSDRLCDNGMAMIQVITVPDTEFETYRKTVDFIQKFVFPGGMLLSPGKIDQHARAVGLILDGSLFFAESYVQTLDIWRNKFNSCWKEIAPLGFDDRFRRMWEYYLSFCAAGFRNSLDVGQFRLIKN